MWRCIVGCAEIDDVEGRGGYRRQEDLEYAVKQRHVFADLCYFFAVAHHSLISDSVVADDIADTAQPISQDASLKYCEQNPIFPPCVLTLSL